MGRSLTSNHVYNAEKLTKAQFKKKFTDAMKVKGYTTAKADDSELCYALVFSADRRWVTVLTEESTDTRKEAAELAKSLDLQVLSVELVDSDFAELTLFDKNGAPTDTMFLGEPYFEEYPEPSPLKWQTLLGIDWSKVEEIQQRNHTFAEEALSEFSEAIGCENMLLEYGDAGDDAEWLYFKKAGEKKLTLNAAFKQVFGPELEKQGFKLAKGTKKPFFVRVISDEIIHLLTVYDFTSQGTVKRDERSFRIEGGVISTYFPHFSTFVEYDLPCDLAIYTELVSTDKNAEIDNTLWQQLYEFKYKKEDKEDLLNMMFFSLAKTKEFLLHEMSKVKDLGSCIRYCIKYQKCISIRSAFNTFDNPDSGLKETGDNSLIIIKANYRDDGITYMHEQLEKFKKNETRERERMDFTSGKLITYRPELDLEKYKKEYESLNRYRIRRNELRDKIFNTPELYNKAIELADKIKAENIEVLRSYGIKI